MKKPFVIVALFSVLSLLFFLPGCSMPAWLTYTNTAHQFQLQYPPTGSVVSDGPLAARIRLPIQEGTNLVESYLDIAVETGAIPCLSPYSAAYTPPGSMVADEGMIGGVYFVTERASEGAAGTVYEWIAYSTANAIDCVSLTFVLISHHPGVYPTPLPLYDHDAEEILFLKIVESFEWLGGTVTPASYSTSTLVPTWTPTPAPFSFIPDINAYCRSGPDPIFGSISLAMQGQPYPMDGRNQEDTWFRIMVTPEVGCWVPADAGTPSRDTSGLRVLAAIPIPTFTALPFSCSQFNQQACGQHPECIWNRRANSCQQK